MLDWASVGSFADSPCNCDIYQFQIVFCYNFLWNNILLNKYFTKILVIITSQWYCVSMGIWVFTAFCSETQRGIFQETASSITLAAMGQIRDLLRACTIDGWTSPGASLWRKHFHQRHLLNLLKFSSFSTK